MLSYELCDFYVDVEFDDVASSPHSSRLEVFAKRASRVLKHSSLTPSTNKPQRSLRRFLTISTRQIFLVARFSLVLRLFLDRIISIVAELDYDSVQIKVTPGNKATAVERLLLQP